MSSVALNKDTAVYERPIGVFERLWGKQWVRKAVIIATLAMIWEIYGRILDAQLLMPTFSATVEAFMRAVESGVLIDRTVQSLKVLLMGYAAGVGVALVLTLFAMISRIGSDLLQTLTSMFNPLPAIALLPLALVWFGLGVGSMIFVLVHAVVWAIALNTQSGFAAVSHTLRMVGRNYGLSGAKYIALILIPAALPSILSGLRVAWAFAWRTLIAAELIFGVSAGSGGLGWYIFEQKNSLDMPSVFAGLLTVILIGLFVEEVIFRMAERYTVKRWGMQTM
jgi:NitT/TauT family transport system permease protein